MTYKALREKHPTFTYESYSYYIKKKDLVIRFSFSVSPNIRFEPEVVIENIDEKRIKNINPELLENLIFHLGLAEIPSYWKATTSPQIIIKAGYLSKSQITWWQDLLENGLAEFFYVNKIPFSKKFVNITSSAQKPTIASNHLSLKNRYLVPMGGGKDSFVSAEILKESKAQFCTLVLGNVPAALNASRAVSNLPPITIQRKIDPSLISLNKKGYLNGHTPFSSYLAFLTVLCGVVFDYRHIAISQERSSDEGNLKKGNRTINHQYSKSFLFEKKFRVYLSKYLSKEINYFSLLRPVHELQIAYIFSQYQKHFSVFKSCNVNLKENSWCKKCPKCFTIYLLLSPFLEEKELQKIFKGNLLNNPHLWSYIPAFLGKSAHRPFDCISTIEETRIALELTIEKYEKIHMPLPLLLERYRKEFYAKKKPNKSFLVSWNKQNFVPKEFQIILRRSLNN